MVDITRNWTFMQRLRAHWWAWLIQLALIVLAVYGLMQLSTSLGLVWFP